MEQMTIGDRLRELRKAKTISSKNEVISIQKDFKNEVTFLYSQFNSDIINEKNEQIKIYKEVVDILNKKI